MTAIATTTSPGHEKFDGAHGGSAAGARRSSRAGRIGAMSRVPDDDRRQLQRMIQLGFIALLVPALIARLTGWRWRPWPPGPEGYSSIVAEARAAADTYIPLGFIEW